MAPSSRIALGTSAFLVLSLAALGGCGSSVEGDPSDEGEGGSGTGGAVVSAASSGSTSPTTGTSGSTTTGQGGAPSTSSGSLTTTSSSSGQGGATSSSSSVGAGGAPSCDGARSGEPCDVEGLSCEDRVSSGECDGGKPRITSCVNGAWEIWTAATCGVFEPGPECDDIAGRYRVEPSGSYEPDDPYLVERFGAPFEIRFEVRDDGRLYASADLVSVDPGTCEVSAFWSLDEDCEDIEGESFCVYHDRFLDLSMASAPGTGTVEIECWGECGNSIVAPVTATRR